MGDDRNTLQEPTDKDNSLQELHPAKKSENITALENLTIHSEEKIQTIHDELPPEDSHKKVETFLNKELEGAHSLHEDGKKKPNPDPKIDQQPAPEGDKKDEHAKPEEKGETLVPQVKESRDSFKDRVVERKPRVGSAASGLNQSDERMTRNQSDIFSLKEETSIATAIFSVNGSPSRKIYRRRELAANNVFPSGEVGKQEPPSEKVSSPRDKLRDSRESYNDLKRPSSSIRNPLTGTGLSSNDEYKGVKGSKRRDGNPLLGVGYSPEATPSAHRIPPGGFSHKLW